MDRQTHDDLDKHVEKNPDEARSGEKSGRINWVLHISTAGAVLGLVLVWIFVV